ncbi:DUF1327 domain-containing protein [Escherichia coli]|nr:DUF1327 domain-containing protein [Escherichia coli]
MSSQPEKRPIILEAQNLWITYKGKLPGRITGSLGRRHRRHGGQKKMILNRPLKNWRAASLI